MSGLDRRAFFGAAAGSTFLPAWLARAFGSGQDPAAPADGPDRAAALRAAADRAVARGKPLLVLLVPDEPGARGDRGQLLGALINHGGPAVLVDLAMTEPACATSSELEAVLRVAVPATVAGAGEARLPTTMVLVERGRTGNRLRVTPIAPDLRAVAPTPPDGKDYRAWEEAETARARARVEIQAAALRAAVAAGPGAIGTRADDCRATLTEPERAGLERFFAGRPPPGDALLVRAAAVLRMAAEAPRQPGDRERLLDALADAARRILVEQRLPGSRWASSTGCGVDIEGKEEQFLIACGMGHVPPLGRRFLYFFTDDGR